MQSLLKTKRRGKPRKGALTLEWVVIVTVLVIGVIGGLGLVRKAVVDEMADMSESIISLQVKTQAEIDAEAP